MENNALALLELAAAAARHAKVAAGFVGRFMYEPESDDDDLDWHPNRIVYYEDGDDGPAVCITEDIDEHIASGIVDLLNAARDWQRVAVAFTDLVVDPTNELERLRKQRDEARGEARRMAREGLAAVRHERAAREQAERERDEARAALDVEVASTMSRISTTPEAWASEVLTRVRAAKAKDAIVWAQHDTDNALWHAWRVGGERAFCGFKSEKGVAGPCREPPDPDRICPVCYTRAWVAG